MLEDSPLADSNNENVNPNEFDIFLVNLVIYSSENTRVKGQTHYSSSFTLKRLRFFLV